MSSRKPFVGGNWKMNLHSDDVAALTGALVSAEVDGAKVDVAICPAFPYLPHVHELLDGSDIMLGAQDAYQEPDGAFTGEVSLAMLQDVGVQVVIVGHSERRHVIAERDELINAKVLAALGTGFEVILCVGEKIEQREAFKTNNINAGQVCLGLAGVSREQMAKVTIAYEPVWAIGTGKTATTQDAREAHVAIRKTVAAMYGDEIADQTRIQYGGSVKPGNAAELFAMEDIDGGLIGGASLKADDFLAIVNAAADSTA